MAAIISIFLALILGIVNLGVSGATWCVCKPGLSADAYQTALDYACGNGVDCKPIQENGTCYMPNDKQSHCSYAVNSYFQFKAQAAGTCVFSGTTAIVTVDPSPSGGSSCVYPSISSPNSPPTASPTPTGNNTTPTLGPPNTSTNFTPTALSPYINPNFSGFGRDGKSVSRPGMLSCLLICVSSSLMLYAFYYNH